MEPEPELALLVVVVLVPIAVVVLVVGKAVVEVVVMVVVEVVERGIGQTPPPCMRKPLSWYRVGEVVVVVGVVIVEGEELVEMPGVMGAGGTTAGLQKWGPRVTSLFLARLGCFFAFFSSWRNLWRARSSLPTRSWIASKAKAWAGVLICSKLRVTSLRQCRVLSRVSEVMGPGAVVGIGAAAGSSTAAVAAFPPASSPAGGSEALMPYVGVSAPGPVAVASAASAALTTASAAW
jgi:hypothetical protein